MIRKCLGILICCVLVFSAVQAGVLPIASAATIVKSGSCGVNVTYTLDSDGLLTISGTGEMENYSEEYHVSPFNLDKSIKKIIIERGLESIGNYTFYKCTQLKEIIIPDSVISIGNCALYGCSELTDVVIPSSVKLIGDWAFAFCTGLKKISILPGVTSIGVFAFYSCTNLLNIPMPNSIQSIGQRAFCDCSELKSVSLPKSITSIEYGLFSGCKKLSHITIPDSVTSISAHAFSNCYRLTSVEIPSSIENISESVFQFCQPIIYGVKDSVAQLYASENDYVFIEKTLCSFGHSWDRGVVYSQATDNKKGIIEYTCTICNEKKTEYLFTEGFLIASGEAENSKWYYDKEGTLTLTGKGNTLPDSFRIGDFNNPGDWYDIVDEIKTLVITGEYDVLETTGFDLFKNLETADINLVKALNYSCFSGCDNLSYVKTGPGVYYINSFGSCYGLQNVDLDKDVRKLGGSAFSSCRSLKSVRFESGDVLISNGAFSYCGNTAIVVPAGKTIVCEDAFRGASANVHFLGDFPELRGELDSSGYNNVICYYPCNNDTWKTRLPRTVEWREEHKWDAGVVKAEPTDDSTGITVYTCTVCGEKREEITEKPKVKPGDVNGDGDILANDARLALRASAKLEPLNETQFLAADVDGDGKVLAGDARQILRYSAKLQNEFVKAA